MPTTPVRATGVECTDLPPTIQSIKIMPSPTSEFGIEVLIHYVDTDEPVSYGVREFIDLAEILDGMVPHVRSMAAAYKAPDEVLP